jgi:hypothetical protein
MQPVVVYDLATLRFRRSARGTSMSVVAASGEVLAVIDTLAVDENEDAAYAACEHALATCNVERGGEWCKIALYNPYSGEISYQAAPDSRVFSGRVPVALESGGSVALIEEGAKGLELVINGQRLFEISVSLVGASRAWAANEERGGR